MNKDIQEVDRWLEIQDAIYSGKGTVVRNIDRLIKKKIKINNMGWSVLGLFSVTLYVCVLIIWSTGYEAELYQQKAEKEAYIASMNAFMQKVAVDRNSIAEDAKDTVKFMKETNAKP